jgi:gas vesicle protein
MNRESFLKYGLSFLFGVAFGAAVALLYAPSSGEELRTNIKTQADTQYARLQDDWQKGFHEMQTRMDKMSSDLQAMSKRANETGKTI